ncbi:hypothetical protein DXG01_013666 [Tephrocybe rancida]|nr:hypothetical protein DXG01_013666 [Tephrocybe rancida]
MAYLRQTLPPELIDAIIDASARDTETLRALSVLSKLCVARCRTHLFQSVEFSTDDGEEVLARRHQNFCSILDRDPHVVTYVQKLAVRDIEKPNGSLPWMITSTFFHQTIYLLGRHLKRFTFVAEGYEWDMFPATLKQAFMAVFTAPNLRFLCLHGLDAIPSVCCVAFGSQVEDLSLIKSSFSEKVDPELPTFHASSVPTNLYWLGMEDVDEESIGILLNAWVPAPTAGQDRPLFPSLTALNIGPTDERSLNPLSELIRSGRETIQYFYWDYSHGTHVRPLHTSPLSLSVLQKLFAINYEVTFYPDDDIGDIPDIPDYFDGLITLLRTAIPGAIQQLEIKVNFHTYGDALDSLNVYDGWSNLDSLLDSELFDQLLHLTVQIDLEAGFNGYEMKVDDTFEERKVELEALLKSRLPCISEVESFTFLFQVERRII